MSLIVRVPGVVFTQSLPKLYRDAVIGPSTLFCYDALNSVSWPKQAAPANGNPSADKWANLVDGVADGLFTTTGGEVSWNGGFVSNGTSSVDKIALRNNAIPAAPTKFVSIVWLKHGAQVASSGEQAIANFFGWGQIAWTQDGVNAVVPDRFYIAGSASAAREIPIGAPVAGNKYQLAMAYDNNGRVAQAFVNGVEVLNAAGFADLAASVSPAALLSVAGFGTAYVGTIYRALFDTLTDGRTPAQVVALDYALNAGRFA